MQLIDSGNVVNIMKRTLDHIDTRLIDHGERVSFIVLKLLNTLGITDRKKIRDYCLLALLHDIGAYKTEEIDRMAQFETGDVWAHSTYGYLFIKHLSPLAEYAPGILFHHTNYAKLKRIDAPCIRLAQLINLADRQDFYFQTHGIALTNEALERYGKEKYSPALITLFQETERRYGVIDRLKRGDYFKEVLSAIAEAPFNQTEIDAYLRTIVFAIDFRSHHTVTHTITTESIAEELAKISGMKQPQIEKVRYGALLHDLGKIAIPVEILEFPGKLSPQAMKVMRTHVTITEEILGGEIDPEITLIALRHHEKLNGTGYPRRLAENQLTESQRILAVADIVSALSGTRSYKQAFDKPRIIGILEQAKQAGELSPRIVNLMMKNFDVIMENVRDHCDPVLKVYNNMNKEFDILMKQCESI